MNRQFVFVRQSASTNTRLKATVRRAAGPVFDVLCAEMQTQGRGRRGNAFYSPAGGIYFSAAYPLGGNGTNAPFLTLLAGLAAAEALEALTGASIQIKWPNDLYLNGKKLGGILTELVSAPYGNTAVVGFGVNAALREADFPPALRGRITSFAAAGLPVPDVRAAVKRTVALLDAFVYGEKALCGDTSPYAQKIAARAYLTGRRVEVRAGDTCVRGVAAGVAPDGSLLLDTPEGRVPVRSGTVTAAE